MRVSLLEKYLVNIFRAEGLKDRGKQAVLLVGPPGIGKSTVLLGLARSLAQIEHKEFIDYSDDVAEEILKNPEKYFIFVDFRLTECEPSDLMGIPYKVDGAVRFAPLLWAKCLSVAQGMLVLDEITKDIKIRASTNCYNSTFSV